MKTSFLLLLPLVAGCLSSAPKAPAYWTIDFGRGEKVITRAEKGAAIEKNVRIASVDVRAPFSGQRLAVLRADGSIAFDAFNSFAGSPSLLIRGAAFDAVESSGLFRRVLAPASAAMTDYTMEIVVTDLALDCRAEGERSARVALMLVLLENRSIVASVRGEGVEKANEDYSAAFSTALARAIRDALGKVPVR